MPTKLTDNEVLLLRWLAGFTWVYFETMRNKSGEIGVSAKDHRRMCDMGLIVSEAYWSENTPPNEALPRGISLYAITPAGRAALAEAEGRG